MSASSFNYTNPSSGLGFLAYVNGGVYAQGVVLVDQNGNPIPATDYGYRTDPFTTTTNGTLIDLSATPCKFFSIAVKGTSAVATSWTVKLEGSLDGTNWTTLVTHTDSDGDGILKSSGSTPIPVRYIRSNCTALSLGSATNIIAAILAMA